MFDCLCTTAIVFFETEVFWIHVSVFFFWCEIAHAHNRQLQPFCFCACGRWWAVTMVDRVLFVLLTLFNMEKQPNHIFSPNEHLCHHHFRLNSFHVWEWSMCTCACVKILKLKHQLAWKLPRVQWTQCYNVKV